MSKAILYYVYDPMCSWCWGYQVTWDKLHVLLNQQFATQLHVQYVVGGLAPDSDVTMTEEMQRFLQETWSSIHAQLGTPFNVDFWTNCQPKRSTYPACRAILVARQQGLEKQMLQAIQQGYYLQAKNPSELATLTEFATQIGLEADTFQSSIKSELIEKQLQHEISMARQLPIQGFPSLVLHINGQDHALELDYLQAETSLQQIQSIINAEKMHLI
ncbi:DsbA family protein [Psychromonas hadalis]|uniref:DsbA family protein n=1 Tax=Psychromonas hadalis TaxID=211669 RepID=UPI0003B4FAF0|nr:DsbA family protein [Psychromonas hadalis]